MSYLDRLKAHIAEKPPCDQPSKPPKPSFDGFEGYPRGRVPENYAKALLGDWNRRLSRLDVYEVPDGFEQNRWGQLVLDAWWLYEEWASRLVRDGYSALDLWAVVPARPGIAGLADRLHGSRSLLIDDTGKVYWRRLGVSFELSLGVGEALRGSDARLLWELQAV